MKRKFYRSLSGTIAVLVLCLTSLAQTSEFTYQGKLTDVGSPSASYDFIFRLCDSLAASCATPLATDTATGVTLGVGGIFTVPIDFGAQQYQSAQDHFIEVAVRRLGEASYTTLSPRTKLTATPIAVFARTAANALNLENLGASDFVQVTDPRIQPNYGIRNGTTLQSGVDFNISGTGSANVLNAQTHFSLAGQPILSIGPPAGIPSIYLGFGAGRLNTGTGNSFLGSRAGFENTSGIQNTFVGTQAGNGNSTGSRNTFVGNIAGMVNTTGVTNTFVGASSGFRNTTGLGNVFLGYNAGSTNVTGQGNLILGTGADVGAANLSNATAIGSGAIVNTSNSIVLGRPGDQVQIPGSLTMNDMTVNIVNAGTQFNLNGSRILSNSGQLNLFAGVNAGAVTTGGANAFFGSSAGATNTTGDNNAFVGAASGGSNTSGRFNAFFGGSSGQQNTTGNSNTFVGQSSGTSNSTGNSNSFFGSGAGSVNAGGNNNTVLGASANVGGPNLAFATAVGAGSVVSSSNTLVLGRSQDAVSAPGTLNAGVSVNAPSYRVGGFSFLTNGGSTTSTFVGTSASCSSGTNGLHNTFVGNGIGQECITGGANIVVGSNAGFVGPGNFNTIIGTTARVAEGATVNNSTAIGALAVVSTSNTIVLGTASQRTQVPGELIVRGAEGNDDIAALKTVDSTHPSWGYGLAVSSLHIAALPQVFLETPICFQSGLGVSNHSSIGRCPSSVGLASSKTNIKPFTGGLDIVKRLNPTSFRWKEYDSTGVGLNVEEVAAIDLQLVSRDDKGEIININKDGVTAVLINAIKQQQYQIEKQQKQIEALRKSLCSATSDAAVCKEDK